MLNLISLSGSGLVWCLLSRSDLRGGLSQGSVLSCPAHGPAPGAGIFARAMPQLCRAQAVVGSVSAGDRSSLTHRAQCHVQIHGGDGPEQNKWELGRSLSSQNVS